MRTYYFVAALLVLSGIGSGSAMTMVKIFRFPELTAGEALARFWSVYLAAYVLSFVGAYMLVNADDYVE